MEQTVPARLREFFAGHPRAALAFSGGVDSAYLLYAAQACGCRGRAYYVQTAFQPAFEAQDAERLARQLGAELQVLHADILDVEAVRQTRLTAATTAKTHCSPASAPQPPRMVLTW